MFSVESIRSTCSKFIFTVESSEIQQKFSQRLMNLQKTVKVNGFRNGKVPLSVIRRMHGQSALADVAEKLANEKITAATIEKGIQPVRVSAIENLPENDQTPWQFSVEVDYVPDFAFPDFSNVHVVCIDAKITNADLEKTLDNVRAQAAKLDGIEKVDHRIQKGNVVSVKLDLKVRDADGKTILHETKPDEAIPSLIDTDPHGVNDASYTMNFAQKTIAETLIDRKKDDVYEVTIAVPDDFPMTKWRNGTMLYTVTISRVFAKNIPDLDANFAANFGLQEVENPVEQLRKNVRANLERKLSNRLYEHNSHVLFQAIADQCHVDLPEVMIQRAKNSITSMQVQKMQEEGIAKEEIANYVHSVEASQYAPMVKLDMVIEKLIDNQKIRATEDQIKAILFEDATEYDDPKAFIEKQLEDKNNVYRYRYRALQKNLYAQLVESNMVHITTVEKDSEYVFSSRLSEETQSTPKQVQVESQDAKQVQDSSSAIATGVTTDVADAPTENNANTTGTLNNPTNN